MRSIVRVNEYIIYYKNSAVYHVVAESETEVRQMAAEAGEDLDGLEIDMTKSDVRDFFGLPLEKRFKRDY